MLLVKQNTSFFWVLLSTCSFLVLSHSSRAAPTSDELDDIFAFRGIVYGQSDNDGKGGNPNLKEDATIYEGIFYVQQGIGENSAVNFTFTGDLVTAASYDDARGQAETVSGATGYNPGRFNVELGWKHRSESRLLIHTNVSYGQEYAYRTTGYGFGVSQSLAEEATTISASVQFYDDIVRMIRFDGSKEDDQPRDTITYNVGLTQALTPKSIINLSWSHTKQSGFLATSFNSVLVNSALGGDEREVERAPDSRIRDTLSVRYKRALGQNSVQTGFSYYKDEWDIKAQVAELRYFYNKPSSNYSIEPSYRYYHQKGASFFAFQFDQSQALQSSDSDLGNFDGHSFGVNTSFLAESWFTQHKANYDIGLNYYRRSDDIDFYWLTLAWNFPR